VDTAVASYFVRKLELSFTSMLLALTADRPSAGVWISRSAPRGAKNSADSEPCANRAFWDSSSTKTFWRTGGDAVRMPPHAFASVVVALGHLPAYHTFQSMS